MTENLFIVAKRNRMEFLAETKTKYLLPIASPKAMCILLNYVLRNGDIPVVDTVDWWNDEKLQEYYKEDEWGVDE